MKFKEKVRLKAIEFSRGRYGVDELSRFLQVASLPFLVIGIFQRQGIFVFISLACMIIVNFRTFSKDIPSRRRANEFYLKTTKPVRKKVNLLYKQIRDWKTYRYLSCPKCDETLRLPKNKGKVRVTCPHCKTKFEKRV